MKHDLPALFLFIFLISCGSRRQSDTSIPFDYPPGTFGYDLQFLRQHHEDIVVLGDDTSGPRLIVIPAYQGRVMTSTAEGNLGKSFGWINHEHIASGKLVEHMNAFGGEERIWLGPEGGQFSFFFKRGQPFIFGNWQVPAEMDTEPYDLKMLNPGEAIFRKDMTLTNYSGVEFNMRVDRTVRLLEIGVVEKILGLALPKEARLVGFETENSITNRGDFAWTKKTGMPSIWILSMLNASPATNVIVPFRPGDSSVLGRIVTDDYFGSVPEDRLSIRDSIILFSADGNFRSKIGISPSRAKPFIGSYDANGKLLTIARYSLPAGSTDYVNSQWKMQEDPFSGDAVNAYNDGPAEGKQMGKFYEIESSSPAAALGPGMTLGHRHVTIHIRADSNLLELLAKKILGTSLIELNGQ